MTEASPKPLQIRPPAHFDRKSKAEFRRILATLPASSGPVSAVDLADFVTCRQRIAVLEMTFKSSHFPKDKIAAAAALDRAVTLSTKLADRLGPARKLE